MDFTSSFFITHSNFIWSLISIYLKKWTKFEFPKSNIDRYQKYSKKIPLFSPLSKPPINVYRTDSMNICGHLFDFYWFFILYCLSSSSPKYKELTYIEYSIQLTFFIYLNENHCTFRIVTGSIAWRHGITVMQNWNQLNQILDNKRNNRNNKCSNDQTRIMRLYGVPLD